MPKRRQLGWFAFLVSVMLWMLIVAFTPPQIPAPATIPRTDTGWVSPSSAINTAFASATNAFANDTLVATRSGTNTTQRYGGFVFNLPTDATITGIEVRADAWRSAGTCATSLNISLSWDNGATHTTAKNSGALGTIDPEGALILGSATDTWGRAWTPTEINSAFRIAIQSQGLSSGCALALDWIPVRVHYSQSVSTPTTTSTSTSTLTPTATATQSRTPTSTATNTSSPTRASTPFPARAIVINEIAWGGTAASSTDEWIELFNPTAASITLNAWTLSDGGDINVTFPVTATIPAFGYFLLERTSDTTISDIRADLIYTGGLRNDPSETLTLRDPSNTIVDTANSGSATWFGGSASPNYFSMERRDPANADIATNWLSNNGIIRNGKDANNSPINGTPKQINSATRILTATLTPTPTFTPTLTRTPTPSNTPTLTLTPSRTATPTATRVAARLLITEVLYDGAMTDDGDEFIEIFNPNATTIDLGGYKIGDEETRGNSEGMYHFPDGTLLAPDAVIVIARNAAQFRARFGFDPAFELVTTGALTDTLAIPNLAKYTAWGTGSLTLANSGDEILLLGPGDQLVDAVAWANGNFVAVGLTGDASANEPKSLQRYGAQDTNQMTFDFLRGAPNPSRRIVPPIAPATNPGRALSNGMFAYWGDLHSHSTVSDGTGPPRMAFATARQRGLHFFALTDHDSWITDDEWNEMGSAARDATSDGAFIALRAFEYSGAQGHINVLNSATRVARDDPAYDTLAEFYAWLARQTDAIAQFNHPHWKYGGDFYDLKFDANVADKIALIEIGNNAHGNYATFEAEYIRALNQRWRAAPTNNSDHHDLNWGSDSPHRVGIVAPALTHAHLLDALSARRVFATEDANLALTLQSDGAWMGATIRAQTFLTFTITISDPDPEPVQLFLLDNGGVVQSQTFANSNGTCTITIPGDRGHNYFARAVQRDGNTASTAPIWSDYTPMRTLAEMLATPNPKKNDLSRATIAQVHAAEIDSYAELDACVTAPPNIFSERYIYIQDDTGGIRVYLPGKLGYFPPFQLHERVGLRGYAQGDTAERYVELTELRAIQSLGMCAPIAPVRVPLGDITRQVEGLLVEVRGTISDTRTSEFVLRDSSGDALVFIDYTTNIRLPRLTRGQPARVIGVVSRAHREPAILPRFVSDLDFGATPALTRSPFTATPFPTRTPTRTRSPAPAISITPRATASPTQRARLEPTASPESPPPINFGAAAVVGGSATAVASVGFFAIGFALLMRQSRK
ncbi:MAG: lamin tail domain-containing protein [Chloroflexi bacterium]|nr:lamin tail domain-containing protein [Chloroflexota bacterium]